MRNSPAGPSSTSPGPPCPATCRPWRPRWRRATAWTASSPTRPTFSWGCDPSRPAVRAHEGEAGGVPPEAQLVHRAEEVAVHLIGEWPVPAHDHVLEVGAVVDHVMAPGPLARPQGRA